MKYLIIILAAAAAAIIVLVFLLLKQPGNPLEKDKTKKHVIVANGVNMDGFGYGREYGDSFDKKEIKGTVLVDGRRMPQCNAVFVNQGTGEEREIFFHSRLIIGRISGGTPMHPVLTISNDRLVSKKHCSLTVMSNGLLLEDLHSHNHTYLNGKKLTGPEYLKDGDEITVGYTKLRIHFQIR